MGGVDDEAGNAEIHQRRPQRRIVARLAFHRAADAGFGAEIGQQAADGVRHRGPVLGRETAHGRFSRFLSFSHRRAPRQGRQVAVTARLGRPWLLVLAEEVLVDPLELDDPSHSDADSVLHHQLSQAQTID